MLNLDILCGLNLQYQSKWLLFMLPWKPIDMWWVCDRIFFYYSAQCNSRLVITSGTSVWYICLAPDNIDVLKLWHFCHLFKTHINWTHWSVSSQQLYYLEATCCICSQNTDVFVVNYGLFLLNEIPHAWRTTWKFRHATSPLLNSWYAARFFFLLKILYTDICDVHWGSDSLTH